ncbi:WXG100 family type VII secretion target [Streptomyces sp. NPDC048192]|jgi:WXG100 family type VII secretion target|uniref:WXG100 family type VII secretion target n=1 Tax=unclassified Streptomyces TaxID=2593676 RepID=UPI0037138A1E
MGVNNSGVTEVHYDGLDHIATEIANQAKNLEASLETIKREVQNVSGMWEGEAHQAYIKRQAEWDREARAIHEALHAIGRAVHAAGGDYMGGDKKAASYFQ